MQLQPAFFQPAVDRHNFELRPATPFEHATPLVDVALEMGLPERIELDLKQEARAARMQ